MNDDSHQPNDNTESGKTIKKAIKYPPPRRLIVGKGLSKKEMVDAVMEFYEACQKETEELNREHKR